MKQMVAAFGADFHFWPNPPIYRSAEEDWYAAMDRPLRELRRLLKKNNIPFFVAGDAFEAEDPDFELANWLMDKLPEKTFAIPGQHDLNYHNLDLIKKTAFWNLVMSGTIGYLYPEESHRFEVKGKVLQVQSKPWGFEIEKLEKEEDADIFIYLAHQYVFKDRETCYSQVSEDKNVSHLKKLLKQVDVAVFGDNHIPFSATVGKTQILNCGTLLRRKVDERKIKTGVWLLFDDLSVERYEFDQSKDVFLEMNLKQDLTKEEEKFAAELLKELEELDTISVSFQEEILRYMEKEKFSKVIVQKIKEIFKKYKEVENDDN